MNAIDEREILRVDDIMLTDPKAVFVFGSNRAGVHGGGAARTAQAGVRREVGSGRRAAGSVVRDPDEGHHIKTLPLEDVANHVACFSSSRGMHPDLTFAVTRVGCGLAGFTDAQIAPLFADAPATVTCRKGGAYDALADGRDGRFKLSRAREAQPADSGGC
jgi:hypothetical protein